MGVLENIAEIKRLSDIVESHPVGGKFDYSVPGKLRYLFFDEWLGLNGVQISIADGKANALTLLIKKLDSIYNGTNRWWSWHQDLDSLK